MSIKTLLLFLIGHRPSIEAIYNSPKAVWVGLLFVISAGFAREYDGEDLLHEPWHVLLPLGASLVTSFLLFALLELSFRTKTTDGVEPPSYLTKYRRFLGLYWLTAPLAWLYAIPVEEFLSPTGAVSVNLSLLGIVSLWRVLLITRAASIVFHRSYWATFFVVMLFADTVAMVIFWLTPLPILSVMGGIRLTESEEILLLTGIWVRLLGTVTWLVWLIGTNIAVYSSKPIPGGTAPAALELRPSVALWSLATGSIVIWAAILPFTQPRQLHRREAEHLLYTNQVPKAVEFMSRLHREDFPSHWDPPPHLGYQNPRPAIDLVLLETEGPETADWVRETFREKIQLQLLADPHTYVERAIQLNEMDDERLARYVEMLKHSPLGPRLALYHSVEIEYGFRSWPASSKSQLQSLAALKSLIPGAKQVENSQP